MSKHNGNGKSLFDLMVDSARESMRVYNLKGQQVFIKNPSLTDVTRAQTFARIKAIGELSSQRAIMEKEPIDAAAWEQTLKNSAVGEAEVTKPLNAYEQQLNSLSQQFLLVGISARMIVDSEGNFVARTQEQIEILEGWVGQEPELIRLIGEVITEFSTTINGAKVEGNELPISE